MEGIAFSLFAFSGIGLIFLSRIICWARSGKKRRVAALVNLGFLFFYSVFVLAIHFNTEAKLAAWLIAFSIHIFILALIAEYQLHKDKRRNNTTVKLNPWSVFAIINTFLFLAYSVYFPIAMENCEPGYSDIGVPAIPGFGLFILWLVTMAAHVVIAIAFAIAIAYDRKQFLSVTHKQKIT
jgi:hypothetical protein